jgi:flavodoxin
LIAYFSRAEENYGVGVVEKGNTQIVAEMIVEETGGDLFHIQTVITYPDDYDECTEVAKQEKADNARPELDFKVNNFKDYDVIYLGYPIWWSDMPMAVYTFLESYDFSDKTVIPFNTHAGDGQAGTVDNIKEICSQATFLDGLVISGADAQNEPDNTREQVVKWVAKIQY